jgi:hypothetical protein
MRLVRTPDVLGATPNHSPNASGVARIARGQLGAVGQLEIGELEPGRNGTAEQTVCGLGWELDTEPRTGPDDELGSFACGQVEPESSHLARLRIAEEQDVQGTALVEMKNLVGAKAMEVGRGLLVTDEEVNRRAGRTRLAMGADREGCAIRLRVEATFGVRRKLQAVDELAHAIHRPIMLGR